MVEGSKRADDARPRDGIDREADARVRLERLEHLEEAVELRSRHFFETGIALFEILEQRLYRMHGYATFEQYVRLRFGTSRGHAYRMINAARVIDALRAAGVSALPSNEAQARELVVLVTNPAALCDAWARALERSKSVDVTAADIRAAVASRGVRSAVKR